jgi:hypothetical protein
MTTPSHRASMTPQFLPPGACAPWCDEPPGPGDHVDPDAARDAVDVESEDHGCSTIGLPVELSTEPPVLWSDGVVRPARTTVQVVKDPGRPAAVCFADAPERGVRYTPDEAEAQARVLRHAAWVARQTY